MLFAWIKPATIRTVIPLYSQPMLVFLFVWLFISSVGEKYRVIELTKFLKIVSRIVWINFIISAIILGLIFVFKLDLSRLITIGTIVLSTLLEIVLFFILYYTQRFFLDNPSFASNPMVAEMKEFDNARKVDYKKPEILIDKLDRYYPQNCEEINIKDSVLLGLLQKYLDHREKLFEFINDAIALEKIAKTKTDVINTNTLYNIEKIDYESLMMFINLHPMNDFRRINKFLKGINESLALSGIFIGCAETLEERKRNITTGNPKIIARLYIFFDFVINRVFPKLNVFKAVYFFLTKGRNRPLSKCEILGRLYFCGFEIIKTREINNKLFFIVKKIKKPSEDKNPSYAPIFKMKRSGKNGKPIYVYKFRTMHPYAEYLQHYMVETYGYGGKGKVEDDFRVTTWGKWMRKLWLDELPQLLNWVKGDLALVGVRPLSDRFLKEYPEELKEERFKYKPGCIPPYVALKMQAVEAYIESERIYLREKKKHPIWTDIKYFWWAVYNILTNKIRSE
jgi:lipopolysaccharide/colanic/teichoic acid biosynthesis glycosyltransferase